MKYEFNLKYADNSFCYSDDEGTFEDFLNGIMADRDFEVYDYVRELVNEIQPEPFGTFSSGNFEKLEEKFVYFHEQTIPKVAYEGDLEVYCDGEPIADECAKVRVRKALEEAMLHQDDVRSSEENGTIDMASLMIRSLDRFMAEGEWQTKLSGEDVTVWFGIKGQEPIDLWTIKKISSEDKDPLSFWTDPYFMDYFDEFMDGYNYWAIECGIWTQRTPQDLLKTCPINIQKVETVEQLNTILDEYASKLRQKDRYEKKQSA